MLEHATSLQDELCPPPPSSAELGHLINTGQPKTAMQSAMQSGHTHHNCVFKSTSISVNLGPILDIKFTNLKTVH